MQSVIIMTPSILILSSFQFIQVLKWLAFNKVWQRRSQNMQSVIIMTPSILILSSFQFIQVLKWLAFICSPGNLLKCLELTRSLVTMVLQYSGCFWSAILIAEFWKIEFHKKYMLFHFVWFKGVLTVPCPTFGNEEARMILFSLF